MNRISSGMKDLDSSLGGGFPVGYNFVLHGDIDTTKSVFVNNLVHNSLNSGGAALYVLTNRLPENVLSEVKEFGWDFNKHLNKGLHILDCFSAKAGFGDNLAVNKLTQLSIAIDKGKEKLNQFGQLFEVFDSTSDFFINNDSRAAIRFVEYSCARALKTGSVALFLVDPESQDKKDLSALESVTQGTVEMKTKGGKNLFRVAKLVGLPFKNDWFEYDPFSKK